MPATMRCARRVDTLARMQHRLSEVERTEARHALRLLRDRNMCATGLLADPAATQAALAAKLDAMLIELGALRDRLRK